MHYVFRNVGTFLQIGAIQCSSSKTQLVQLPIIQSSSIIINHPTCKIYTDTSLYIYIMICHIYRYTTYINIPHYKYRYTTIYPIYIQYIVPGRGDLSARCAACRALRGQLPLDDQLRPLHAVAADALMVRVTGPVTGSVVRGFSIGLPWTTLW